MKRKGSFWRENSLSIVFFIMALLSIGGQSYMGWCEYNEFLQEKQSPPVTLLKYFSSGHFLQATFENWESEFFQMAFFVLLTVFLRQKGSSESKEINEPNTDDKDLKPLKDSPWPVKKGGLWLAWYKYSLSFALVFLFLISFLLHWYGSWIDYNEKLLLDHQQGCSWISYLGNHKFWFESFQNWQSEFLSIFAIIYLSIYLRHWGSSQSKPVNASYDKTGE